MFRELRGLARSIAVYHLDFAKRRRGLALYSSFVRPGDLVFDLGAHTGGRVGWFRALDARVVAVEPNPALLRVIRLFHGRDPNVAIEPVAIGREAGRMTLHYSTGNPMLTTLDGAWVESAKRTEGFDHVEWDRREQVAVRTLDQLIVAHGRPDFVKIDVEAAEADVLSGLSAPVPALSFEVLNTQQARAEQCLDILEALGPHRYRYSPLESFALEPGGWIDAAEMKALLRSLPPEVTSGDVYARGAPSGG